MVNIFLQIDPFKMHGRKNCVHLFHLCPQDKIKSPDIVGVFPTRIEHSIQVIVDIGFELFIIFPLYPSEPDLNEPVVDQLIYVLRQGGKRRQPADILGNSVTLGSKVFTFPAQFGDPFPQGIQQRLYFLQGDILNGNILCVPQKTCKFIYFCQQIPVGVDLDVGR